MKKVVAIDMRMLHASGIGRYLQNIVPHIAAAGPFEIVCLGHPEDLADIGRLSGAQCKGIKARIFSIEEQFELPLTVPKCDIFWSPHFNIPLLPIAAKHRIVTIHDVFHLAYYHSLPIANRLYAKFLITRALSLSDQVITDSEFSKSEIMKYTGADERKLNVIHCAVDDEFDKNFRRQKIDGNYILFVGNVKPHKNLKNALLAFRRLCNTHDIKFYIVGKREGFITGCTDLSGIIDELADRVVFTGHISDEMLKNYYADARLFILPSFYEGFGLPILEAMKFNLPIVASHAASIPEVGGEAITYFNPHDVGDIADKIEKAIGGSRQPDTKLYADRLSKFSWPAAAGAHIELFNKTIHTK